MKIVILAVGGTTTPYIREATADYLKRIARYMPAEFQTVADARATRSLTAAQQKEREADALLAAFKPSDRVVLLDERGREFTSREFAQSIQQGANAGLHRLVYVIGGPYGFSERVYARADAKLSLSKMTFSHEMVRLFFAEQVYRAMTILRGEPYHHD